MTISKDGKYLIFDLKELEYKKKISARTFVGLVGFDNFKTPEDYILVHHGIIEEKVDPKYLRRGDYAEAIVKKVYEKENRFPVTYNKQEIKFDNFKHIKTWGGLIDIELFLEAKVIEVKSKNVSAFEFIKNNPPKQEYYQGLFYSYLRNYDSAILEWIFFDDETEKEIFEGKKPTTLKNLKRITKEFEVDRVEMEKLMNLAYKKIAEFRINLKIEISKLSPDVLQEVMLRNKGDIYVQK